MVRVYLPDQFSAEFRGRGNAFGEAFARIFAGVLAPFLMEPHVGEAFTFFGTITIVLLCGRLHTSALRQGDGGQLEVVSEPRGALLAAQ